MEFHVVRQSLLSELTLMMGIIEKKNTMPILANVFIKAENNMLSLQATDLEVGIITECPAQVIESGEFTVNAKRLNDILNTLTENQVTFSMSEGSMLDLVCGSAQFSIETMSTQDFPSIPEYDFSDAIKMENVLFRGCINKVLFSISSDPHKYALNGSLFKLEAGHLYMVSTDGHRMSVVHKELAEDVPETETIIPRKTMIELKKSLQAEEEDQPFQIGFSDNRIFFKIGVRTLFSRLIDGKFPDYNKAIPSNNDKEFDFERGILLDVLRRKMVLSSDKSKLVRLSFSPGKLVVVLKNAERGESVDTIDLDYDGDPLDVGFNVEYLHEFLKNMTAGTIRMHLKDEANQGLFTINDDELDLDYKHVIMPMRLSG